LKKLDDGIFVTNKGTQQQCPHYLPIAGGLGSFDPGNLNQYLSAFEERCCLFY